VPEIVDPPNRLDTGGHLRRPLTGAEVVDVEVAASLARKQQGEFAPYLIRSSASSARS
jgi:hypothetical protein